MDPLVVQVSGPLGLQDVDRLARLVLLAGRIGVVLDMRVDDRGLLDLTGLGDALGLDQPGSALGCGEPLGQAEAGEQRRVQEVVDVDQLPL